MRFLAQNDTLFIKFGSKVRNISFLNNNAIFVISEMIKEFPTHQFSTIVKELGFLATIFL